MPSISHRRGWQSLIVPGLFAGLVMAALLALGFWQLRRLAWKEAIIHTIETRIHAPAGAAPVEAEWAGMVPEDADYRHVTATGVFAHDQEALVFRATANGKAGFDGPGYLVLTPLILADGSSIIINRGFVPINRQDPASRTAGQIAGPVKVTGLLRPSEPRNAFTPADDPDKNQWFTRDPALIAAHFHLARAAPFTIDADAVPGNPGALPAGGATVLAIPNDHLSYALTWFGLAFALAGVFIAFAFKRLQPGAKD